ncbi:flagellar hook-basal body complex protein FliE [Liquorilactobacillus mali]|uniref:Flagellar hook-basal body complex protein FliE n=1 Tax=Liquorilactobacillus mali TaxID=1618 RepID=A0A0R2FQD1_9LACO|nr:flagellar hook-basal body complex protein FliE [Liquorilactobacillus mali]KRN30751.1 flagellar hook-basal body complex protein FliE [Liquorilactobacillus mali]
MAGISGVSNLNNYSDSVQKMTGLTSQVSKLDGDSQSGKSFSDYLTTALSSVSQNMSNMDQSSASMVSGNNSNLGDVMIKMTEAQLSLETAVQVRNKCIDAYNDIANMQF